MGQYRLTSELFNGNKNIIQSQSDFFGITLNTD